MGLCWVNDSFQLDSAPVSKAIYRLCAFLTSFVTVSLVTVSLDSIFVIAVYVPVFVLWCG